MVHVSIVSKKKKKRILLSRPSQNNPTCFIHVHEGLPGHSTLIDHAL